MWYINATLSLITHYVVVKLSVILETLSEPFSISTLVCDPLISRRVYIECSITVYQKVTSAGIGELEIVDLDIMLYMNLLHSFYDLVNCRTRTVRF